jgi:diguanylate cyclase (GGDEF)-like protein
MEPIYILCLSSKPSFAKKIKDSLKSFQDSNLPFPTLELYLFSELSELIPADLKKTSQILIIDLESLELDLEKLLPEIAAIFHKQTLVLAADDISSIPFQIDKSIYRVNMRDLESPLFLSFIYALYSQAELIESNLATQENLNNRLNELLSIRKASLSLTMNLSLDAVLEAILESAVELVSADDTHIFLYEHGALSFAAALFDGHQQKEPYMHPRPHGLTYQVAREGKSIVVNDTLTDPLFKDRRWEGSIISLPLKIGSKVLGVMNVALKRAHLFTDNEIRALEFLGDQASVAIQNAKLFEQAQQEIADRKKAEKAIKHLANHDALTGLPNRRLLNERILLEISRAQRHNQKIGVMLFDLDQLKNVNDSYGHNVGDLLLQAVAQRLLGLLRKSDTVARMGGDEFILILPEMRETQDAIQTAERILSALSTPFLLEGYEVNISTSIGISFFPDDGDDAETLTKKADIAMYKAKDKGGDIYHIFTP